MHNTDKMGTNDLPFEIPYFSKYHNKCKIILFELSNFVFSLINQLWQDI